MTLWTALWIGWALAFAVIEGAALKNDVPGDTLSEHLRRWFSTDTHRGRWLWLATSGLFFAWFVTHIAVAGSA